MGHDQPSSSLNADIDGDTAIVGVPTDGTGNYKGAAYVFVRVAGNWIEEAKLLPIDSVVDGWFGSSVAISGNRVFVGAKRNSGNVPYAGAVYVFHRTGTFPFAAWTQQAKLVASDGVPDQCFGLALSLSGTTLVVGAPGVNGSPGAAYVFTASGANWTQQFKLLPVGPAVAFGEALSVDGDTAIVGQPGALAGGVAHVFDRVGTTWTLTTSLAPSTADQWFGFALELDGDAAIVGSPNYTHSLPSLHHTGAICAYFRHAGTWTTPQLVEAIVPQDNGGLGGSLALQGDRAIVSGAVGGSQIAYAFRIGDGISGEIGQLRSTPGAMSIGSAGSGDPIGISGDLVIAAGGPSIVYSLVPPMPVTYCSAKVNSAGCLPAMNFEGVASATAPSPFLLTAQSVLNQQNGMLFFGLSGQTSFPFQGGTLCVLPPIRRTIVQDSGGNVGASDCSGTYTLDFNAVIQAGTFHDLVAGVLVDCQFWSRDPASPSTTGLTNAVEFGVGF